MNPRPSRVQTWLQLFRAPNLFTVPGDPLAGFLIANWGFLDASLPAVIAASVCFYAAGLLQNDLADLAEDTRDRPRRPLPSGAEDPRTVRRIMWALNSVGLALCAVTASAGTFVTGLGVVAAVTLYNRHTKKFPVIGAINMGLCRSLSVMLGAFAGPLSTWQLGLMPAAIIGLYIAAVTNLARHETGTRAPALARILPAAAVFFGAFGGIKYALNSPAHAPAIGYFLLAVLAVVWLAIRGFRGAPLPPLIGAHIRILLVLQAAISFLGDPGGLGLYASIALVAMWPVSARVSKRFYAS